MRTIERTVRFKRDYKRELKGQHGRTLQRALMAMLATLSNDHPMAEKHRDHALTGEWSDHRDCHIKPDLILIYRKIDPNILQLVRLGSHSELSL